jgi:hypothetical protein
MKGIEPPTELLVDDGDVEDVEPFDPGEASDARLMPPSPGPL